MLQLLSKHRLPVTILLVTIILAVLIQLSLPMAVYAGESTSTTVTCTPNPADQSGIVTCTATVAAPNFWSNYVAGGTVTWTQSKVVVGFKSTSCTLKNTGGGKYWPSCSVTAICNGYGVTTITAEYPPNSDLDLNGSKGSVKLTVWQLA
jgi:ABC-type dipeptide/oligopeptide/nickel transport system permease component